jgi:tRNA(Arg) A34 adenosine deaminase TadA
MRLTLTLPDWVATIAHPGMVVADDDDRMRLAIRLSRENVLRDTGGPFGAVIFERQTGRIVGLGVNSVLRLKTSLVHAEVMAIADAQSRLGSYTLGAEGMPAHDLFSSCAPCAMCLGATMWSGVTRLVCAATQEDAEALGFDEGPVFAESYAHLVRAGIEVVQDHMREHAQAVFTLYRQRGGPIYNG